MTTTDDWRSRRKAKTRRTIQEQALRLFVEKGYEQTTVDEIAAAANVSHMTFFRYFPRKEQVVEYDEYDPILTDLLAALPPHQSPLNALRAAIREWLEQVLSTDRESILVRTRLVMRTPALRARNWIAQDSTRDLFADALARRAGLPGADLATSAQASGVLAAVGTAITAWVDSNGTGDLVQMVDYVFSALEAVASPPPDGRPQFAGQVAALPHGDFGESQP